MSQKLTPELHRQQIEAYVKELPYYKVYADALRRVFKDACQRSDLDADVQAREKTVSSFAEKCVRRFNKQPDAVRQFTDLCGGRIIVQTLEHVRAVMLFIEANFEIVERDDKASLLGEDKFGYRDMHYLVRLIPERAIEIGFTQEDLAAIGNRIAEVQVRSLVQHAWANILHDRMYKAPLKHSSEAKRTTALLGAIMEDGDRTFERLASELDGMAANYTAYADRETVKSEIGVQELILASESAPERRAEIALRLARLLGPCGGYERVIELLEPFAKPGEGVRTEVLLELGFALCRQFRDNPRSAEFLRGQKSLSDVIVRCSGTNPAIIPNPKQRNSLLARAYSRLAWSWEATQNDYADRARDCYRGAVKAEPSNPYHLANQLGFEIFCSRSMSMIDCMRTPIEQAVQTCRDHAIAGTELPYAHFAAGRLSLLLDDTDSHAALSWYARGLRHLFASDSCVPPTVLDEEEAWVRRLSVRTPKEHQWILRLFALLRGRHSAPEPEPGPAGSRDRVLIIAGGAATMKPVMLKAIFPILLGALRNFRGAVISGGTKSGIPGCVGEIAATLRGENAKQFDLTGYIPCLLPADAPRDERYDRIVEVPGDGYFSPGQVLRIWEDLAGASVHPKDILLLGFGGGKVTAVEYRVACALGATVAAVAGTGGASDEILKDPVWNSPPAVLALPFDPASIWSFVTSPAQAVSPEELTPIAQAFHENYRQNSIGSLPEKLRPWGDSLPDTYKTANIEQARYAVEILRAVNFDVRFNSGGPDVIASFAGEEFKDDVERMAELEHGRWNVERLRNGWRPGLVRDDANKIHDCIVNWQDLPDAIREFDRIGVRAFPEILAKGGLEVFRKPPLAAS